jgi:Flp pilus assembly protein TadG
MRPIAMLLSLLRGCSADRRGTAMVEFGLAMPLLCVLLVGLLDLGKYSLQKSSLLQGAREGAHYGIMAHTETANINTTAQNATGLTGVTATNSVFCECVAGTTVLCTATCGTGITLKRYITVTTSKSFSSVLGGASLNFGSLGSFTPPTSLSATITMIVP